MNTRGLAVVALVLLGLVTPVWAQDGERRAQFGVFYAMPTDDLQEEGETLELDEAVGFQASFEFMVTDKIGIEPGLLFSNHDVEGEGPGVPEFVLGDMDFMAVTGNVNFHVRPGKRLDLYLGPTVGYVFWGDLDTDFFGAPETFAADDEFLWGGNIGLDIPFGDGPWELAVAVSYLFTEVTLEGGDTALGMDPITVKVGASRRF